MYNPIVGRWISRDPYAQMTEPQIVYSHAEVAKRMGAVVRPYGYCLNSPIGLTDPSGLLTVEEAVAIRCQEKCADEQSPAARLVCFTKCFINTADSRKFEWWFEMEEADTAWQKGLPLCPCSIKTCDGVASPDPKVWTEPSKLKPIPRPNRKSIHAHPGGTWEIRTKNANDAGAGNQCVYDENGDLITGGDAAGSADRRNFTGALTPGGNAHTGEDLNPFLLAWLLDGEKFGEYVKKYLKVRPAINDPNCKPNIVPKA